VSIALRAGVATAVFVMTLAVAARSFASETDNFTCRSRPLQDALVRLDALINGEISEAIERANDSRKCDAACLARKLQDGIGANVRNPWTGIGSARLARQVERDPGIDRCHLKFKESVYGARPYNRPWMVVLTGRIMFLADTIRLDGRIVGIDKINHFIREGLAHWRDVYEKGEGIERVLARELGVKGWQLRMNEHGLKGMTLTGVLSYADLAASYSGYTFWNELLAIDSPGSFVVYDRPSGHFRQRRAFTFADYVNDAWDEGINRSVFHPDLAKQVTTALRDRSLDHPIDCQPLSHLPQANLYLNPACLR
jgi:hypothetical protein